MLTLKICLATLTNVMMLVTLKKCIFPAAKTNKPNVLPTWQYIFHHMGWNYLRSHFRNMDIHFSCKYNIFRLLNVIFAVIIEYSILLTKMLLFKFLI